MDSPDGLNRLSPALLEEIAMAGVRYSQARRFILTGNAWCFSAGADLNVIAALGGASAWRFARRGQAALSAVERSPIPFVAAVAGSCLGGGLDLALACHVRICTPDAYFGHHGSKLGLVTGWGGTQRLPRLIGMTRALEHLLTAQGWSAARAQAEGLARSLASPSQLLTAAISVPTIDSASSSNPDSAR